MTMPTFATYYMVRRPRTTERASASARRATFETASRGEGTSALHGQGDTARGRAMGSHAARRIG